MHGFGRSIQSDSIKPEPPHQEKRRKIRLVPLITRHMHASAIIVSGILFGLACPNNLAAIQSNFDDKVEARLGQMTLEEKNGQMTQVDMNALTNKSDVQKYFLGSVLSGGNSDPADITPRGWLKAVEEFQSLALKTRLKIPLIYGIDAVHGHHNVDGAVIFPHNIGMSATRNPDLVERTTRVTALEMTGTGHRLFPRCLAAINVESVESGSGH